MQYKKNFIIIVLICTILGIFFALLNNELVIIKDDNNSNNKFLRKKNNGNNEKYTNEEKIERRNIIPIAINIDNNYYLQAIVFLTSLLENIGPKTKYEIYIMISDQFNNKAKKNIDSLMTKYGKEKLYIKYINMKYSFREAIINEYISTAAYYRLLLPSLLPSIDKIIYSDCDVINFEDLSDMYNLKLRDNIYFRGFLDFFSHTDELLEYGLYSDMYINSGILLMNLKSLRINAIENELIELCNTEMLNHHDQTAINLVCSGHLEKLPIKFAIFKFESFSDLINYNNEQKKKYRYSEEELKEAYHSPVNLHYAGFDKPWNHKGIKFEEYWWYYAKISDFYEEILYTFEYSDWIVDKILERIPKNDGFIRFKQTSKKLSF